MTTRVCGRCGKPKSVNGVWYIVPDDTPGPFMCGSCFSQDPDARVPLPV